ncbi:MAG: murein L,D-transpeptidase catalytic domain family protein [Sphingomonadaceae bacterium]|nr:murein L,D-transpeptidase catalytic domain family protein [Sphingomonadaceae bacterium]
MGAAINRRKVLLGGAAATAALCLPARAIAATASSVTPYQRKILETASRERDRVASKLWRTDIVGIADYAQPSWKPRMHLANLENGTVRSFLTAHGKGSDREHDGWLKSFSKVPGSHATSRGAYLTCEWYTGKYGTSVRLAGLDQDNMTALERLIVIHPAWYAESAMVEKWGKLGRSQGCFALGHKDFNDVLFNLSGGRLLFADRIGEG